MTTTLTAKRPEDLLAAVPLVLGFEPEDSLVMLTFGADHQFHARLDLPRERDHLEPCVDALLRPAIRHRVQAVVFVVYADGGPLVRRLAQQLSRRFRRSGIRVIDCLRAHEGRWFALPPRADVPAHGVPYDVSGHEFRAAAVYDGRVTLGSRAELVAGVAGDPTAVAETERALVVAEPLNLAGLIGLVSRSLPHGRVADTDDLASLLLALADDKLAHQAWSGMRRDEAAAHVTLWTDVVRRAPDGLVADPAAILALAAWLAGDGALAWCALDRCLPREPGHPLGTLMSTILTEAVPPATWEERNDPEEWCEEGA